MGCTYMNVNVFIVCTCVCCKLTSLLWVIASEFFGFFFRTSLYTFITPWCLIWFQNNFVVSQEENWPKNLKANIWALAFLIDCCVGPSFFTCEMGIIKSALSHINGKKCWWRNGEIGTLYIALGKWNDIFDMKNSLAVPEKLNIELLSHSTTRYRPKKIKNIFT